MDLSTLEVNSMVASLMSKAALSTITLISSSGTRSLTRLLISKLQLMNRKISDSSVANTLYYRLWEYRNGAFVNVNSGKVLDIKGGEIEPNG
jgi:hypothetical protein